MSSQSGGAVYSRPTFQEYISQGCEAHDGLLAPCPFPNQGNGVMATKDIEVRI